MNRLALAAASLLALALTACQNEKKVEPMSTRTDDPGTSAPSLDQMDSASRPPSDTGTAPPMRTARGTDAPGGMTDTAAPVNYTSQPQTKPPPTSPKSSTGHLTPTDETLTPAGGSEPAANQSGRIYVVKKGDTLSSISRKVYNDNGAKWKKIWEANRNRIKDPNKLEVGTRLIIP